MALNQTKPTVQSVEAFLDVVPDEVRRADAKALATLMAEVTGELAATRVRHVGEVKESDGQA